MLSSELRRQRVLLAGGDAVALVGAFSGALFLHDPGSAMEQRLLRNDPVLIALNIAGLIVLWLLVFRFCDLYRMCRAHPREWLSIFKGCTYGAVLSVVVGFLTHLDVSRITLITAYLLSVPMVATIRSVNRAFMRGLYASPRAAVPLVIIGFNHWAHQLFDELSTAMTPYEVVCFIDSTGLGDQYRGCPVFDSVENLPDIARLFPSLEAAIVVPEASRDEQKKAAALCDKYRIRWAVMPWVSRWPAGQVRLEMFGAVPLVIAHGSNIEGLNFALKRLFDVTVGSLILLVTLPIFLLGALAVRIFDGSPVLFRQVRIGIHGTPFEILKLRTMRTANEESQHREYTKRWIREGMAAGRATAGGAHVFKLDADERITSTGRILRRFSIDELPQLINVIRGEMSLIGPRPALPYEVESYKPWHLRRLDGIPGITGLWQVSGRNRLSFDEMVRLDVKYLQEWSLTDDLRILARTIPAMLRGSGL